MNYAEMEANAALDDVIELRREAGECYLIRLTGNATTAIYSSLDIILQLVKCRLYLPSNVIQI
ncbi:hypothetical protein Plhal304r1_c024g0081911 [Plasmopara halstedii]